MNLQIAASQLSLGVQGPDVARLHQALGALGRDVPAAELNTQSFGPTTSAVVKALQTDLGITASGVVDAVTIAAINAALAKQAEAPRTIRGRVLTADGRPAAGLFVQMYLQTPNGEDVAGRSQLDGSGGYQMSYHVSTKTARVDVRIEVRDNNGPVETAPPGTSILPDADFLEVVDFTLSGAAHPPGSEVEQLIADLKPLLGTRDLAKLTNGADVSLLAVQSGWPAPQVAALAIASRIAAQANAPVPVLYGLVREGLPPDLESLQAAHPDVLRTALDAAVANGNVPKTIDGAAIETFLPTIAARQPTAQAKTLLGRVLQPPEIDRFFETYRADGQDPAVFWKRVGADQVLAPRAARLKLAIQVAGLTDNHDPLVAALLARDDIKQASDLVTLTKDNWMSLVQANGIPPGVPGATAAEQMKGFAAKMLTRVEAAFPTPFFAARLGDSPVGAFLRGNPTYDFKTTYPPLFFKQNPAAASALNADQLRQLQSYQRLYRLTGSAADTIGLAGKDLGSAQQIARMSPQAFADQHKDVLPQDRAQAVYDRALRVSATALALYGENAAGMNRTALRVLPRLDTEKQAALAANNPIPDWETLFGSPDSCACSDCESVHGAAAYFVDALHFLDDRGVRPLLFQRRGDLGDVELSCQNTDTPLPFVDLVNEILEDAVAPPLAFAPFDLAPALEADLDQSVASSGLSAAFNPPLDAPAKVEAIDAGTRWRIWDEPFAYTIVKQNGALKVAARSRQTNGSTAERRATPQYRNDRAYTALSQAVYPWALPFDLYGDVARVFLAHLGVPRRDLIDALSPARDPLDPITPIALLLAGEGLGLSDLERKIVVGEPLPSPQPPEAFWGGATATDLATVRKLLDRSGLTYADLKALIATRFINPSAAVTITPGAADACDTTAMVTNGLTAPVLARLHVFVRLWRVLGWSIGDLDRAVCGLAADANAPAITNAVIVKLDHLKRLCDQLRLSPIQALALWKRIDTVEPGSLYRQLFDNPAIFKPQDPAFQLRSDANELIHAGEPLAAHTAALQAVFRLNAASLALIVARTDGTLSLANLSLIYRHATLAQQLRLTVESLLIAIDLTGIDPFKADNTEESLRFVAAVTAVQTSPFDWPRLDYLLRHRFNAAASFVPTDDALAEALADVRAALLKADGNDLRRSAVIDRVSAAIGVPADVTSRLLDATTHTGQTALQRLLALSAIAADPMTRAGAAPQFETLEKLLKIAGVIQAIALPGTRLDWLFRESPWLAAAPDPSATPVAFPSWFPLIQLDRLRRNLTIDDGAVEGVLGALGAVASATDNPGRLAAKQAFVDALATWLGWSAADLQTLIGKAGDLTDRGLLDAGLPDDYRVDLLVRLSRAVGLLRRLGVTASQAAAWCGATVTADNAQAIRGAAKSKYDDTAWQTVVVPLQDALRDRQREALVAYLSARPSAWTTGLEAADADDLYAYFLIDVQMSSCQQTSRIKQAIGSVQLFAQRCLMGLEAGVQTNDPAWHRWNDWMKSFRVWEANRKIWLYPENWIEPELRDDKSPFFADLESELLQSDLDNAAAEQALMHYLEKLDQVARLEIAGTYQDTDGTVHVFGRTFNTPHVYFYRRRNGATLAWTPWEKVDLDIDGDHIIPVVWNGAPMLIWPVFSEKQDQQPVTMPGPHETLPPGSRHWEIQLAWSELQYGRWTARRLSDPVRLDAFEGEPDVLFGDFVGPLVNVALRPVGGVGGTGGIGGGGGGGTGGGGNTGGGSGAAATALLPVPRELFTFKASAAVDALNVRGYLRLDYAGAGAKSNVAFPFGEFRFSGCRKIVTTAHRGQMLSPTFALAPQNTVFDAMWFDETGSGLVMLDGTFPSPGRVMPPITVESSVNVPQPLPTDASSLTAIAINIPVLGAAASTYRLLAPHQDPQFIGNRPFFYMDWQRAFVISSTGSSGFITLPEAWVTGDLAVLGMASAPPPADNPPPATTGATGVLTVLARDAGGARVARTLPAIELEPPPVLQKPFVRFWSNRVYSFQNFHHPYVCRFVESLQRQGIDALLALESQQANAADAFQGYQPTKYVAQPYPVDEVEFRADGAYEIYNWELFFHIPLLIATRLSANQRFKEAQRWFHYTFHPTGVDGGQAPQAYWRMKPFYDRASSNYEQESVEQIETLAAQGDPSLQAAVNAWRDHPFNPYAVARLRTTAFQKTVVMRYLDNLIAWGDQLFRTDTIEAINEATQLYVLAAAILGRRPEIVERAAHPPVQTFNSLAPLGLLSNALAQLELLIPDSGSGGSSDGNATVDPPKALYFCLPENDRLLGYWDTVADRLFKIRHCMNIEGQVRQLPLFEPPIDPALLVRAQAAGLSLADVMSDVTTALPNYRFTVMLQKAGQVTAEVRELGSQLLSVLEKKDGEALSTLRSGQELQLLKAVRDVRARQVDEAAANVAALEKSRDMAQARKTFYESRAFMNPEEQSSQQALEHSLDGLELSAGLRALASILGNLGAIKIGSPTTAGLDIGPNYVAGAMVLSASASDVASAILSTMSQLSGRMGDHTRRQDDWNLQSDLATIELQQLDQQLAAANIRLAMAERDLDNHDLQIDNARAADEFLRGKFTNQELFQWMVGQVSGVYFQSYQFAYDFAKRAEVCLQHELGLPYQSTSFIRFGYWDSLRKGLLAADLLARDLKRLDVAYMDGNVREYELTKHVSLLALAPEQLIALKETGTCQFEVPEWLFDLDTPGHYLRRIRMVSVTIPCVIGPYTNIYCKVQLLKSAYRQNATLLTNAPGYARLAPDDPSGPDVRFVDDRKILEAIVTSTAQNDAGLFEASTRDERYLPFEGAGAISTWQLDLSKSFRTLDYQTITDIILHLRYTAREGGQTLGNAAATSTAALLADANSRPLRRLFSLRHEFPAEWNRFVNTPAAAVNPMTVDLAPTRFPYFAQGRTIAIREASVVARAKTGPPPSFAIAPGEAAPDLTATQWTGEQALGRWTVATAASPKSVDDAFVMVSYTCA